MAFIKKLTASSSATLSFVDGASSVVLDNTYKEYLFIFKDIHPATDGVNFTFNGSDDTSGHSYDITKTTTVFRYYHGEDGSNGSMAYSSSTDLAQSTSDQRLNHGDQLGNGSDENFIGYLHLFNPSSTTFVKHFMGSIQQVHGNETSWTGHMAGYINTTSAIDEVRFKASSGNIDAGDICLYGIN